MQHNKLEKATSLRAIFVRVLSALSLMWAVAYSVGAIGFIKVFSVTMAQDIAILKYIPLVAGGAAIVVVVALFTVPQYVGFKIISFILQHFN